MKTSESTVVIRAPAKKVWPALTRPDLVKQWQYGSDLLTTWEVGTPVVFRNEWNGNVFEQWGTVLEFAPVSRVKYSLFVPRLTSRLVRQDDPRPSLPDESSTANDGPDVLSLLKELVENKMP